MKKIVHLSSVHSPNDPRIFRKQCKSLAQKGYEVVFVVPHTRDERIDGVQIKKVPIPKNRLVRAFKTNWQVYRKAAKEEADVYHFHDPELIFVGILLRSKGAKVIYDVHEDYITSILQKGYLPGLLKKLLAFGVSVVEKIAQKVFFIILAEKYYEERFPEGEKVLNYPAFNIIQAKTNGHSEKKLLYTGTIAEDRGALHFAEILNQIKNLHIHMIGRCSPGTYDQMLKIAGESKNRLHVRGVGEYVPYEEIVAAYEQGGWLAGLALFPATPHYVNKELTKFFEYMAAGIPVLCSNFPVWKALIEESGAGICIDPDDDAQIVEAVDYLYRNPDARKKMGKSGQEAVKNIYNWEREAKKLINFYENVLTAEGEKK